MTPVSIISQSYLTEDIIIVRFKKPDGYKFEPGQYLELKLQNLSTDNTRKFSIASCPEDGYLEIITRYNPTSSYKKLLKSLMPGKAIEISSSIGDFILPKNPGAPIICLAYGIGITPFLSIMKHLNNTGLPRDITLVHVVKTEQELLKKKLFKQTCTNYITEVTGHSRANSKYVDELFSKIYPGLSSQLNENTYFYISGPENSVIKTSHELTARGFNASRIITDAFVGYSD